MNKEKLLYFLGIKDEEKLNKFAMGMALKSDILYSAIIIGFGLYFGYLSFSFINIACLFIIVSTTILFSVYYKKADNVIKVILYTPILFCVTTLKLLYGYWVFANGEKVDYGYALFSWAHMTILIVAVLISLLIFSIYYGFYRYAKKTPLEELTNNSRGRVSVVKRFVGHHPWIWLLLVVPLFPYIVSMQRGIWTFDGNLGMGVCFWIIFCSWIDLFALCFPKLIVALKHRSML